MQDKPKNENMIYKRLRIRRNELGLSQAATAVALQKIGIHLSQQDISRIERNKRFVLDFELIGFARILQISPKDLFDV